MIEEIQSEEGYVPDDSMIYPYDRRPPFEGFIFQARENKSRKNEDQEKGNHDDRRNVVGAKRFSPYDGHPTSAYNTTRARRDRWEEDEERVSYIRG